MEQYFGFHNQIFPKNKLFQNKVSTLELPITWVLFLPASNVKTNITMENRSINSNTPTCHRDRF
jgi:hypothetical protein